MTARTAATLAALLLLATACSRPAPAPAAAPAAAPTTPTTAEAPPAAPRPAVTKITATVNQTHPDAAMFAARWADEQFGWLTSGPTLRTTSDGGRTWRDLHKFEAEILTTALLSRSQGWVATYDGLFATADGGQTWTPVETPGRQRANHVQFVTDQTGWVTVQSGTYATNDGGKNWAPLTTPCGGVAHFINPNTGWALCAIGGGAGISINELHRTDDGGATWIKIATPGTAPDYKGNMPLTSYTSSVFFLGDGAHGWIGDAKGGLITTRTGGREWELLPRRELTYQNLHFFTPERGVAVLTDRIRSVSTLVATQDGGKSWAPISVRPAEPWKAKRLPDGSWVAIGTATDPGAILTREENAKTWRQTGKLPDAAEPTIFSFIDRQHGWASTTTGQTEKLYQTTDGGQTWRQLKADSFTRWTQIDFVDAKTGFLADQQGPLQVTHDGGATFETAPIRAQDFRFVSPKVGWLLAENQKLSATADGGATWNELTLPIGTAYAFDLLPDGTGAVLAGNHPDTAELYITSDDGKSWTWIDLGDIKPRFLKLTDAQTACIWDGVLYRQFCSQGGFETWTQTTD